MLVVVETIETSSKGTAAPGPANPVASRDDLMAAARANPGVQAVLEIFPADIKDVTELK